MRHTQTIWELGKMTRNAKNTAGLRLCSQLHSVPIGKTWYAEVGLGGIFSASREAFRNCHRQRYFTSNWRGIGYSFQLAITAPLYSITGYCIATAQSCPMQSRFHIWDILSSNPCWNWKITLHGGVRKLIFGIDFESITNEQLLRPLYMEDLNLNQRQSQAGWSFEV